MFEPLFRRYIWGGRRLGDVLDKPIGDGNDYAESWEVVDHGTNQTCVANGPLRGTPLAKIVQQRPEQLFGKHGKLSQFPLLFKLLDANRDLSVQVHPDDACAAELVPPDLGKTEAWVVLAAEPGSVIYAGLKDGFDDRSAVAREIDRGKTEFCLHTIEPQVGDCIFIPAGVVHAIGAGLLVAEIQQASDTTYRLFDWNRVGNDGQPRQLHIEEGLAAIDYAYGPVAPQTPQRTESAHVRRLVACDKFVLDRWDVCTKESIGGDDRFHINSVIDGSVRYSWESPAYSETVTLPRGQTVLIPAAMGTVTVEPIGNAVLLDMYLP